MRAKIIACETVAEEIRNMIPDSTPCKFLKFGLHCTPDKLHETLQQEIDETQKDIDTILFGYGMCSRGTVALEARTFRLVIPRVDDCIALFLGSRTEYTRQSRLVPGTFYLTKGWIECGDDPYTEYLKLAETYGEKKAYRIEKLFIKNYTRLALINTGNYELDKYRDYARKLAEFFDLTYEELPGSSTLIGKLLNGDWDEDFVVVEPGERVRFDMFRDL